MSVRTVAIIQARMGSARLPGKVLMDIVSQPMLWHVVTRVQRSAALDDIVVATSTAPGDGAIVDLCSKMNVKSFRGSELDVLDRYEQAAAWASADIVVRITSDCPLIDPGVVDSVVTAFLNHAPDVSYASNTLPCRTFPRGLDTEVLGSDTLRQVWLEGIEPAYREHVTLYIHHHPHFFRTVCVTTDHDYSHLRWTVDTPEDLALVRCIYGHFGLGQFSWQDVLHVVQQHPEMLEINRAIQQKVV